MPNTMNDTARKAISDIAKKQGFTEERRADGSDLYRKNLVFRSPRFSSAVFINRETGMTDSGEPSYLLVAVHPDSFNERIIDIAGGIEVYVNQRTKGSLVSSSNYAGFPVFPGNKEPCGRCYKVQFSSVERLFNGLLDQT